MNHTLKELYREPGVTNAGVNTYRTDTQSRDSVFNAQRATAATWNTSTSFARPYSLMTQQSSEQLLTSRQILCGTQSQSTVVKLFFFFFFYLLRS